jgi:hypothetical protein
MKNTILTMPQIATRVRECFTVSRLCGSTHVEELERVSRTIWQELGRKYSNGRPVYSRYLQGFAQGLIEAERFANYREHLEFCYVDKDGTKYSTRKGAARSTEEFYKACRGHELGKLPGGHYWIVTGKPYSTGAQNAN